MKKIIDKPWGHEEIWAHVKDQYVGKFLHINPGQSLSVQFHKLKTETMFLIHGDVSLHIKNDINSEELIHDFKKGSCTILPGVIHWLTSEKGGVILEVSTDHLDDVVRLQDNYGRV